jgi:hypothetical protein
MTYTVWIHGQQIGETTFEYERDTRRRAGRFQPTEFGLQVLPSITAMVPALFDFGRMCKAQGIDPDSASDLDAELALQTFGDTREGRRVMAAARQIAELQVRDANGTVIPWESLVITDLEWLLAYARDEENPSANAVLDAMPAHEPIKFMISLTLSRGSDGAIRRHFGRTKAPSRLLN